MLKVSIRNLHFTFASTANFPYDLPTIFAIALEITDSSFSGVVATTSVKALSLTSISPFLRPLFFCCLEQVCVAMLIFSGSV